MENTNGMMFDFCPKCGALARGGVCSSCGYGSVPVTEETVPVEEETVPVVEEAVPVVEEAAPVVEEAAQNPYTYTLNNNTVPNT